MVRKNCRLKYYFLLTITYNFYDLNGRHCNCYNDIIKMLFYSVLKYKLKATI